jgi:hypothetical protein
LKTFELVINAALKVLSEEKEPLAAGFQGDQALENESSSPRLQHNDMRHQVA